MTKLLLGTLALCATLFCNPCLLAQEVEITWIVKLPHELADNQTVYMCGDLYELGLWSPHGLALEKTGDTEWTAKIRTYQDKAVEYKFTLGTWETVEKGAKGEEVANRRAVFDRDKKIEVTVERWANEVAELPNTTTGDIRTLSISAPNQPERRVDVWLPPGYEKSNDRYPVLYMLDGQNVFDEARSAFGKEWQADEAADRLIRERTIKPIIIVAIDNSKQRMQEYTRERNDSSPDHLKFIAETIKPQIDSQFRTLRDAKDTTIAGSSLGGLLALSAFLEEPNVFGNAISMSPSLFWNSEELLKQFEEEATKVEWPDRKLWIDFGTKEGRDEATAQAHVERVQRLHRALTRRGNETDRVRLSIDEGAEHNEKAWQKRLPDALKFLYTTEP